MMIVGVPHDVHGLRVVRAPACGRTFTISQALFWTDDEEPLPLALTTSGKADGLGFRERASSGKYLRSSSAAAVTAASRGVEGPWGASKTRLATHMAMINNTITTSPGPKSDMIGSMCLGLGSGVNDQIWILGFDSVYRGC